MNIKIRMHLMPWELDLAMLTFNQLAKSFLFIDKSDNIILESCLNLSNYVIDWDKSKLSKEFFIKKYKNLDYVFSNKSIHYSKIYEGDNLYGHLDLERESISPEIDAYMNICPDMIFSEHVLFYMIEGAKQVKNKCFVITPQIPKMWDNTWDILVNPIYKDIPYGTKLNSFDLVNDQITNTQEISLQQINCFKYAGWFDLYSKTYFEKLAPIWNEWKGKGGWDSYSMNVSSFYKQCGGDSQQYVLKGQTVYRISYCENFKNHYLYSIYKDNIKLKDVWNNRDLFDKNIPFYIQTRINQLKNNLNLEI